MKAQIMKKTGLTAEAVDGVIEAMASNYCFWYLGQRRTEEAELLRMLPEFKRWWQERVDVAIRDALTIMESMHLPDGHLANVNYLTYALASERVCMNPKDGTVMVHKILLPEWVAEALIIELHRYRMHTKKVKNFKLS